MSIKLGKLKVANLEIWKIKYSRDDFRNPYITMAGIGESFKDGGPPGYQAPLVVCLHSEQSSEQGSPKEKSLILCREQLDTRNVMY